MFFNRNPEHLAGRSAVNISSGFEQIQAPLFSGEPGYHPGLDRREIRNIKQLAFWGDEGRADQLAERVGDIPVHLLHALVVPGTDEIPRGFQIGEVVLGQILQLNKAAREPAGPVRAVKLKHASGSAIGTGG